MGKFSGHHTKIYNCQIKPGDYLLLVATAAILNKIIPIALSQQWALFGSFSLKKSQERQC